MFVDQQMSCALSIPYYGSKHKHVKRVLPYLPQSDIYVEPFGGSAAILLSKPLSNINVYNDLDHDLFNFFYALKHAKNQFIDALQYQHCSREQYFTAIHIEPTSNVDQAIKFYHRIYSTDLALPTASLGRWRYKPFLDKHNRFKYFVSDKRIQLLHKLSDALQNVVLYNEDALSVINKYDGRNTLLYVDPPYTPNSRGGSAYVHEYGINQYIELAGVLNSCKSRAVVSCYEDPLLHELFEDWKFVRLASNGVRHMHGVDQKTECLYIK